MRVPDGDMVCKFVRSEEWSVRENRPRANAFKRARMTVWHEERVLQSGSKMKDLQMDQHQGTAKVYYQAGDFSSVAQQVKEETLEYAEASVLWNHSDEAVPPKWQKWRDAHAEVDFKICGDKAKQRFRSELALRARRKCPPESE